VDGAPTYPRSLGHRPGAYSSSSQPLVFAIQLCATYTTTRRGCQMADAIFDPEPSTAAAARLSTSSFAKIDFRYRFTVFSEITISQAIPFQPDLL